MSFQYNTTNQDTQLQNETNILKNMQESYV